MGVVWPLIPFPELPSVKGTIIIRPFYTKINEMYTGAGAIVLEIHYHNCFVHTCT